MAAGAGMVLHVLNVYIPPTSSAPDHVIWDQVMSFVDTVLPSEPMHLLGDFNAHVLGALSLSVSICPCHGHPLHAAITRGTSCGRGQRMWALLQMRNLHVLNGCAHMQLHTCHTCIACVHPTKSTVNYIVVNDAALPTVARAVIVDRPF